jgi:hypothetical protein
VCFAVGFSVIALKSLTSPNDIMSGMFSSALLAEFKMILIYLAPLYLLVPVAVFYLLYSTKVRPQGW